MSNRDEDWSGSLQVARHYAKADPRRLARLVKALDGLEQALEGPAEKRNLDPSRHLTRWVEPVALPPEVRERAEALCQRLWTETGTGKAHVEEALMLLIGVQLTPASLPFLRAAVAAHRERDQLQPLRRERAVATVALLVHETGDAAALEQLLAWLEHPDATVRAQVVFAVMALLRAPTARLSGTTLQRLRRIATGDADFRVRFAACRCLHLSGTHVEPIPPRGVFTLRSSLGQVSRTLELDSSAPLRQLASAILDAFGWDQDHLYEFALTGDLRDRRYVLPTEPDEPPGLTILDDDIEGNDEDWDEEDDDASTQGGQPEDESGAARPVMGASKAGLRPEGSSLGPLTLDPVGLSELDWPIGSLGLRQNQVFTFRYDFGDEHHFKVKVMDVREGHTPNARYPRVVAKTGRAPAQYSRGR